VALPLVYAVFLKNIFAEGNNGDSGHNIQQGYEDSGVVEQP
jgi:hypothetical protein